MKVLFTVFIVMFIQMLSGQPTVQCQTGIITGSLSDELNTERSLYKTSTLIQKVFDPICYVMCGNSYYINKIPLSIHQDFCVKKRPNVSDKIPCECKFLNTEIYLKYSFISGKYHTNQSDKICQLELE